MSSLLLKKNTELYLKHEVMLDDERAQRQKISDTFQAQMATIQEQLNSEREVRNKQIEENNALRSKIKAAIDAYNEKEAAYQAVIKA